MHFFLFLWLCHVTQAPSCIRFNPVWAHYLATHPGARICHASL